VSLPSLGEKIPVEKFHVSETNVNYGQPFGESQEDRNLIQNLRRGDIIHAFKARPEGKGFGVFVGRRRFLSKKTVGAKFFGVGTDCIIQEISDDDARVASWIENLKELRHTMNPLVRAKGLSQILSHSTTSLRGTAAMLGLSPSTLSEWLKILELSPKIQEAVGKDLLFYTDELHLARLNLGEAKQDELAEVLEKEGLDAFNKAVERISQGKGLKRGIPKDVYIILRVKFDKRYKPDVDLSEKIEKLAKNKNMDVDEYVKKVALPDHVKRATA
jgi:ParB-like chromosome segregation protein Spo0J